MAEVSRHNKPAGAGPGTGQARAARRQRGVRPAGAQVPAPDRGADRALHPRLERMPGRGPGHLHPRLPRDREFPRRRPVLYVAAPDRREYRQEPSRRAQPPPADRRHRRRATPSSSIPASACATTTRPERELMRQQMEQTVMRAVEALPEELRTAITLREVEGLSYEEIAAAHGLPDRHGALAHLPRPRGHRRGTQAADGCRNPPRARSPMTRSNRHDTTHRPTSSTTTTASSCRRCWTANCRRTRPGSCCAGSSTTANWPACWERWQVCGDVLRGQATTRCCRRISRGASRCDRGRGRGSRHRRQSPPATATHAALGALGRRCRAGGFGGDGGAVRRPPGAGARSRSRPRAGAASSPMRPAAPALAVAAVPSTPAPTRARKRRDARWPRPVAVAAVPRRAVERAFARASSQRAARAHRAQQADAPSAVAVNAHAAWRRRRIARVQPLVDAPRRPTAVPIRSRPRSRCRRARGRARSCRISRRTAPSPPATAASMRRRRTSVPSVRAARRTAAGSRGRPTPAAGRVDAPDRAALTGRRAPRDVRPIRFPFRLRRRCFADESPTCIAARPDRPDRCRAPRRSCSAVGHRAAIDAVAPRRTRWPACPISPGWSSRSARAW